MIDPVTATFVTTMALPGIVAKCIDVCTNSGMDGWKKLTALGRAIEDYGNELGIEASSSRKIFKDALQAWCCSKAFVDSEKSGASMGATIEDITKSFSLVTGITASPVSGRTLDEVVGGFLVELSVQLEVVDAKCRVVAEQKRHLDLKKDTIAILDNTVVTREDVGIIKQQIAALQESLLAPEVKVPAQYSYEVQDVEDRLASELEIHSQIDTAVEHIKRDKLLEAKRVLLEARTAARKLAEPSSYLLSRIAGNLGVCLMRLEDFSGAKTEHGTALDLRKSRLNFSNLAFAHLFCGEKPEALDFSNAAMGFPKINGRTLAIHLQVLFANGQLDKLESVIKEHSALCNADPDCLLSQGQNAYDGKDFAKSKNFYDEARKKVQYDPQCPLLSASALFKMIDRTLQDETPLDGKVSDETREQLLEIESLSGRALELMNESDYVKQKNHALELRAAARFLLGKHAEAETDCKEILKTDGQNQIALIKLGYLAILLRKDYAGAVDCFEKVDEKHLRPMAAVVAGAYIEVGKIKEAKAVLDVFQAETPRKKLWYVHAFECLRVAEREGTLEEKIADLKEKYPGNGDVLYAIAEVRKKQKKTGAALELLIEAVAAKECTLRQFIPRLKAQTYFDAGLWDMAAKTFKSFANLNENTADCFEYIASVANSGMIGTAGVAAKEARERNGGKVLQVITEIEVAYLDSVNESAKARPLIIELVKTFPSPKVQAMLQHINQRCGRASNDMVD